MGMIDMMVVLVIVAFAFAAGWFIGGNHASSVAAAKAKAEAAAASVGVKLP